MNQKRATAAATGVDRRGQAGGAGAEDDRFIDCVILHLNPLRTVQPRDTMSAPKGRPQHV